MEQSRNRAWTAAFVALVVLECLPIWVFRHFPSQDGPSHLYNAAVMANWRSQPLYQQYYAVRLTPAGNLLFQLLLAGMIRTMPLSLIEPVLLTGYIILCAVAFRVLLSQTAGPRAGPFSVFAAIFAANSFFQTGFWNFMFSIPLALLALVYYLRGRTRRTPFWYAMLTLWSIAVYEMHMASWMALAMALAVFSAGELVESHRKPGGSRTAARALAPLLTLLPPLVLTMIFMTGSGYRSVSADRIPETLVGRLTPLAALSFFRTLSDIDLLFTGLFGALVVAMAGLAIWARWRRAPVFQHDDLWLAIAAACAAVSVLAPSAASGVFIRHRMAFYAWMFLVVWLSKQIWRPAFLRVCAVSVCLLAALPFFWRMPEYSRWAHSIDEFLAVGPNIRPGATVLALDMQDTWHRVNPLLHAVDWLAPKPFIDLRNYEAATTYFPTQFRSGLNPFQSLGALDELQHVPPVFHLAEYQAQTHSPVDYLLFYGRSAQIFPEQRLYGDALRNYKLTYISHPEQMVRLYEMR